MPQGWTSMFFDNIELQRRREGYFPLVRGVWQA